MPEPMPEDAPAAYRADGRPIGRDTFYAVACDPRRSVVVEACAGAGKTWMLVSRILRALLDGAEPQQILAITFTRKAAGEMRQRLNDWLREFAAPQASHPQRVRALVERGLDAARADELAPALAALHERVLGGGRPVEVHTFHAWFAQLLRAAPMELLGELGLQRDMELIETLDDHRAPVFRRFHAALLADAERLADHAALIAERGRSQARRWFEAVWARRVEFELADVAGVLETSVEPAGALWPELEGLLHPADALLGTAWCVELAGLARALGPGGAKAASTADALVEALDEPGAEARFDAVWCALFTTTGTPRKLGTVAALAAVQDALLRVAAQIRQHRAHLEHLRLVRLSRVLLAEYAAYKRSRGLADMADLERCGLALLRDATLAGWVQERLDARIRHVLIDEFQDTSPLQWHALLAWWSGYAGAGGGASGQRPPAVFIVGDPKQSIYRFRRAEPRVFVAARDFVVGQLGGAMLACDHTRRNAPAVLAVVNGVFGAAAQAGEFDGFRRHTTEVTPVEPASVRRLPRNERPDAVAAGAATALAVWRDTLTTPRHEPEALLREREAAQVAAAVRSLLAEADVRAGEIFVLSRKRQSLRLVADALRRVRVPCAAVEAFDLMATPEARDLVAVLDALVSPQHQLSLAQALRSPLFGAGDDDLIALARRAGEARHGDWWRALLHGANPSPALRRAARLLPRWQAAAQRLPPHDLLDRIVAEGELRERLAATVPPEQCAAALGAVDAVLGLALTLDGARYATPYGFVRALRRRALQVAAPAERDAVQLLTVHGAKGLEARVVFVMDADPEPKNSDTATLLVDWPVDAARPRRCAFVYAESQCPPSMQAALDAEKAARQREELNGLYVAMTRARERLVFSATAPRGRAGGASWWQRLEALAPEWQPASGGGGASNDAPAALPPARLLVLPDWQAAPPGVTAAAIDRSGPDRTGGRADDGRTDAATDATRLGQAVHRVLEWSTAGPSGMPLGPAAAAAALEFGAPAQEVARLAERILQNPACAPFFDRSAWHWAGNEVPVTDGEQFLRIDRLVALRGGAGPVWWVLDYKLHHAPEHDAAHREQLLRYRDAVRRMQPGEPVRCAFVTGTGAVVEIDA